MCTLEMREGQSALVTSLCIGSGLALAVEVRANSRTSFTGDDRALVWHQHRLAVTASLGVGICDRQSLVTWQYLGCVDDRIQPLQLQSREREVRDLRVEHRVHRVARML